MPPHRDFHLYGQQNAALDVTVGGNELQSLGHPSCLTHSLPSIHCEPLGSTSRWMSDVLLLSQLATSGMYKTCTRVAKKMVGGDVDNPC